MPLTNTEITEFFTNAQARIVKNPKLREPQREGYRAALQFFRREGGHRAIEQIPVGCGKSGLLTVLPFGIAEGRVLVIAPNLGIRDQMHEAFDVGSSECFYTKTQVLTNQSEGPWVAKLDSEANRSDCDQAHVVVTNIHQLGANVDRWLPQFPADYFDLILVDEGHHNVAPSWQRVFDQFSAAKILSVTATPFRADAQPIEGECIYRYTFRDAMNRGYIKQITALNVAPEEIQFTYRDDRRRHTLDEVVELREEDWFSRGVALAPECNASIVDASLQWLEEARRASRDAQIIGVACSLDHARQIRGLYQERDAKAAEIHSQMSIEKKGKVLQDLEYGRLDAIVQVQMLGEGFDHQPLSVAAIFRPFRSLSPYIQFVGRIMRVRKQDAPGDPANRGFLVSHVGLNIDRHWDDFKHIDTEDQALIHKWVTAGEDPPASMSSGSGDGERRPLGTNMEVHKEVLLDEFLADPYLDPVDDAVIDNALSVVREQGMDLAALGLDRDELRRRLIRRDAGTQAIQPQRRPVQPQARRQNLRIRLDEQVKSASKRICEALGEPINGVRIAILGGTGAANNMGAVITRMNRAVNEFLEISSGERRELSLVELERVLPHLDEIADGVQADLDERSS